MPWTVWLQDEREEPVISQYAVILFATVPDSKEFRLLRYLDPYGDTYFNQVQMDDFLADWAKLNPLGDQRQQWNLVRDMAARCHDEPHNYVRFVGD